MLSEGVVERIVEVLVNSPYRGFHWFSPSAFATSRYGITIVTQKVLQKTVKENHFHGFARGQVGFLARKIGFSRPSYWILEKRREWLVARLAKVDV